MTALQKGKTPLHLASEHGRVAVVRLLMQRGAVVDARDKVRLKPRRRVRG